MNYEGTPLQIPTKQTTCQFRNGKLACGLSYYIKAYQDFSPLIFKKSQIKSQS